LGGKKEASKLLGEKTRSQALDGQHVDAGYHNGLGKRRSVSAPGGDMWVKKS